MATRRPRVLILIKGLGRGGAERLIAEGARFWNRDDFDYRVAYLLPWKDHLVADLEALGVPVDCIGGRRGIGLGTIARTRRATGRSDLVHAHLPSTGVLARLTGKAPVVYTEHNVVDSYRPAMRRLNRWTYRFNDAAIAVSEPVATSVAGFPGPEVIVIPNGVSIDNTEQSAADVRKELDLDDTSPLLVHVGNIRPHKGHSNLVKAVVELQDFTPPVLVVSIGGEKHPGDLERVRAEAAHAGVEKRIRFLGSRSDAVSFLAAADIVVNPSDFEGLPVVLLEALALAKPVVATDVGGVGTIVKHEQTGLLVAPSSPTELAESIRRLLQDAEFAKALGEAGRLLVERQYSLEAMIQQTEDVYRKVLGA